ncbi:MAG: hypothetical protein AB1757_29945 [Acidobacteriota bacterium]
MNQDLTPTKELVEEKVHEMFSRHKRAPAFSIRGFNQRDPDTLGQARVQLAVLKLREGDLDSLSEYARIARIDYREVLAWAEYPNAMKHPNLIELDEESRRRVQSEDRQQYLDWLFSTPETNE